MAACSQPSGRCLALMEVRAVATVTQCLSRLTDHARMCSVIATVTWIAACICDDTISMRVCQLCYEMSASCFVQAVLPSWFPSLTLIPARLLLADNLQDSPTSFLMSLEQVTPAGYVASPADNCHAWATYQSVLMPLWTGHTQCNRCWVGHWNLLMKTCCIV